MQPSDWYGLLVILYLAFCAACGLWTMSILQKRNRNAIAGLCLGLLMGLAGVLIAFVLTDERRPNARDSLG